MVSNDQKKFFFFKLKVCVVCVRFRLPQIYEEFYHTVNNADHEKDLRLWSNTHGVNMAMNWPQFEVSPILSFCEFKSMLFERAFI